MGTGTSPHPRMPSTRKKCPVATPQHPGERPITTVPRLPTFLSTCCCSLADARVPEDSEGTLFPDSKHPWTLEAPKGLSPLEGQCVRERRGPSSHTSARTEGGSWPPELLQMEMWRNLAGPLRELLGSRWETWGSHGDFGSWRCEGREGRKVRELTQQASSLNP